MNAAIISAIIARAIESGWVGSAREIAAAASGKDAAKVIGMLGPPGYLPGIPRHGGDPRRRRWRSCSPGDRGIPEIVPRLEPGGTLPPAAAEYLASSNPGTGSPPVRAGGGRGTGRSTAYGSLLGTLEGTFSRRPELRPGRTSSASWISRTSRSGRSNCFAPDVRERLRSDYRFFLVDEFQDTNDLQYSILKGPPGELRGGNLFIVGDPKQSIYGFRNAEVGDVLRCEERDRGGGEETAGPAATTAPSCSRRASGRSPRSPHS